MAKVSRDEIIQRIVEERLEQLSNPNSSSDRTKTKNDWTALAGFYLFEGSYKSGEQVTFEEFRTSLIKTGAVILAALETSFSLEEDSGNINELLSKLDELNNEDGRTH